jgi:hypothetical protein
MGPSATARPEAMMKAELGTKLGTIQYVVCP